MMMYIKRRIIIGSAPAIMNNKISSVNFISEIATKNREGKAK